MQRRKPDFGYKFTQYLFHARLKTGKIYRKSEKKHKHFVKSKILSTFVVTRNNETTLITKHF